MQQKKAFKGSACAGCKTFLVCRVLKPTSDFWMACKNYRCEIGELEAVRKLRSALRGKTRFAVRETSHGKKELVFVSTAKKVGNNASGKQGWVDKEGYFYVRQNGKITRTGQKLGEKIMRHVRTAKKTEKSTE